MKPIHQTIFGGKDAPPEQRGNCWNAAIASVLELELEDVPHFAALGDEWYQTTREWLRDCGYDLLSLYWETKDGNVGDQPYRPPGYYLVSGKSPRGDFNHTVVFFDGQLAHDPHPSGDALDGAPIYMDIFIALNPARGGS